VRVNSIVALNVVISRGQLEVKVGKAASKATIDLIAAEPLTLRVLALANCAIVENDTPLNASSRIVSLPPPGGTHVEQFDVRGGDAPAPARIAISAMQGEKTAAEFELAPQVVADLGKELYASDTAFVGAAPNRSALVLRIYETRAGDMSKLRFVADCVDADINLDYSCDIRIDPVVYTSQRFAEIERIVASASGFKNATDRLRDHGADMGDFMIPKEVRDAIWNNRARLAAIQVISDETAIPWELACLRGLDNADPVFLAEFGLVRWVKNVRWPADRLRLVDKNVRFLAPIYQKEGWALPGAQDEVAELRALFPAAITLDPTFVAVREFLVGCNSIDVLHVACHGAASGEAAQIAGLYLSETLDDIIDNSGVRQALRLAADSNPIVFLNACQVGRPGAGINQIDGFAQAFLAPRSNSGAAVVVAPLWSVGDLKARTFANIFYQQLLKGTTLVDAVREARAQAKGQSELTWLSYCVYGDPFARVVATTS
jgi:hypothetical protein